MTIQPLAFKLLGRSVLVIGAGRIGVGKAQLLVDAGARVRIVTDECLVAPPAGVERVDLRPYRSGDLHGHVLVVSATGDPDVNDLIVAEARSSGIWLNVVDDPERSDFFFTAVHRDGDVVVSVSTGGASPALAQEVRTMIRRLLPTNLAHAAERLRAERTALHESGASSENIDWRPRIRQLLENAPTESDVSSSQRQ